MFDEGENGGQGIHYLIITSADYKYASCGFGFLQGKAVEMEQNFGSEFVSCLGRGGLEECDGLTLLC